MMRPFLARLCQLLLLLTLPRMLPGQIAKDISIVDGEVFREPADLRELFPDPPGFQLETAALLEYYRGKGVVAKKGRGKQVSWLRN